MSDAKPSPRARKAKTPTPAPAAVLPADDSEVKIRHVNRRDLDKIWEFLKMVFRTVNRETVEFQRPRSKARFLEIFEEPGIEQLLFVSRESGKEAIVAYAECTQEVVGADSWINERYFKNREMRPLFVEELAVHAGWQGRGLGTFVLDQLEHLARLNGCTHLVLEVAENNENALRFYRARTFTKLDAAIFMAKRVQNDPELLPPRKLPPRKG
ncbi:MAG: GNAT family N-acetyltransferase [Beijerinckiaceae bacterium]